MEAEMTSDIWLCHCFCYPYTIINWSSSMGGHSPIALDILWKEED